MSERRSPDEPVSALRTIPIRECGEELVDFCAGHPEIHWCARHPVFDYERFRLARVSAARMLARAAGLLPAGVRLAVVEGWRPPGIQRAMHAATRARLRAQHPGWSKQKLGRVANRFSAPAGPRVPPPHTTGGAVDVHLVDESGALLEFLAPYALMDPAGAPMEAPDLTPEARRSRALLREVMEAAGFTNYPAEWWHWSYGDQGWAYRGGHPEAIYGAAEPPGLQRGEFSFRIREKPGW